ncbi:MAG: hypothetical protein AAGF12_13605 [Myxococcota bacterium]
MNRHAVLGLVGIVAFVGAAVTAGTLVFVSSDDETPADAPAFQFIGTAQGDRVLMRQGDMLVQGTLRDGALVTEPLTPATGWFEPRLVDAERELFVGNELGGAELVGLARGRIPLSDARTVAVVDDWLIVRHSDRLVRRRLSDDAEEREWSVAPTEFLSRLYLADHVALLQEEELRFFDLRSDAAPERLPHRLIGVDRRRGQVLCAEDDTLEVYRFRPVDGSRRVRAVPLSPGYLRSTPIDYPCAIGATERGWLLALSKTNAQTTMGAGTTTMMPGEAVLLHLAETGEVLWERDVGPWFVHCREDAYASMRDLGDRALFLMDRRDDRERARLVAVDLESGNLRIDVEFRAAVRNASFVERGSGMWFELVEPLPSRASALLYFEAGTLRSATKLPEGTSVGASALSDNRAWLTQFGGEDWLVLDQTGEVVASSRPEIRAAAVPFRTPVTEAFGL